MRSHNQAVKSLLVALALSAVLREAPAANFYQGVAPGSVPWPGGIVPYQFDPSVSSQDRTVYLDGMREWELAANIKFVPYTNQANYVILRFDYNQGTNTYVAGNPSVMTIDYLSRAQICHETGHLLGFQHEHVRTDRNSYITVNFTNLQTSDISEGPGGGGISNLYVIDTNSTAYGAYDFESVMHYSKDLFALDTNVDVIDPLPPYVPHYFNRIGNLCISPLDMAGAAYLYGAPATPLSSVVTNTADVGLGSLRAAIYYANQHPGATITFSIPTTDPGYSNGVYTIYLTGELPPQVGFGTVIDATTQPGYAGKPIVAIDGSQVLPEAGGSSGIYFYESFCKIRGLAIQNIVFSPVQMLYNFCISNHVEACYLSLMPNGSNGAPSGFESVNIAGGANWNVIGGTNASQRNVISGNSNSYGITVTGTNTDNNVIEGNYIGVDATGTFSVPNFESGIGIFAGPSNTIVGGTNAGAGNALSGNTQYGVFVADPITSQTVIQGNLVGLNAAGTAAVPNGYGGLGVFNQTYNVTIGGTTPGARNIISGNTTVGIFISGPGVTNVVVQGNFVGLNAAGAAAVPNTFAGIYLLDGVQHNLIGGTQSGAGNVISGNSSEGIYIANTNTEHNQVMGNRIGTDVTGANAIPNGFTGVGIWDSAENNQIGGSSAGDGNLISGSGNGVTIGDTNTSGNIVQGNLIGTTTNGLAALGNTGYGVYIRNGASENVVGGGTAAARNIVSGNTSDGVHITDPGTSGNQVMGNYIGVNSNGTAAVPNQGSGLAVVGGASRNAIGTPIPETRNIISGNAGVGVYISDPGTVSNFIQGDYIGTDVSGLNAISNLMQGIALFNGTQSNIVGGTISGAGNVIAASASYGVFISDPGTMGNLIQGNYIGIGADGLTPLGNRGQGVEIQSGAQGNIIGFDMNGAGASNIIANSGAEGVIVYNTNTVGNTIRGNAIFNNARIGINLVGGTENSFGVTANHVGFEAGPNNLQNYPVITAASVSGGMTGVAGTLNSTANRTYRVDVYRNAVDDPSGHGQGQVYLGSANLATDGSGNGTFLFTASGSLTGQFISTTATDGTTGDTSEFSTSVAATNGPVLSAFTEPFTYTKSGFGFNVLLETNFPYTIEATTNLGVTNVWVVLTNFTATTSPVSFVDTGATNFSKRFYRVVSP